MSDYLAIAVVTGSVLLLSFWIWDRLRVRRRLVVLENRVAGQVVPFWRAIQTEAIDELTHPHGGAERADELLQLLKHNPTLKMTDADRAELLRRMDTVAAGEDPLIQGEDERDLARMFHIIMKKVQKEAANPNPIVDVQIVGLKKSNDADKGSVPK
jgi:hypothetical protein